MTRARRRVPLLAGTRVVVVEAREDDVVLRPPAPGRPILDVGAAVRDALRFPLAGEPLEALALPRGRATILVEPPALPIPGSAHDPRQAAIEATSDELARLGVASGRQTLLVAAGLARRAGRHELETLVSPTFARRFDGAVRVHDAESPDLVAVGDAARPFRISRELLETDVVVSVTAAESVLHGGPATLLAAGAPGPLRSAAGAPSLLETGGARGWRDAVALEAAVGRKVPVVGVSLALHHPRLSGTLRGYPYEEEALDEVAGSPVRRLFGLLPDAVRRRVLHSLRSELGPAAVFAGPPSVAHAEALLRAIEARATPLAEPLDALCLAVPHVTPYLPRERPNPLLAATLALGFALRLWRDAFPLVEGGTAVVVHGLERRWPHPTQTPYRTFFAGLRSGRDPEALAAAEDAAAADPRALDAYRRGRSCHPLLPHADWASCGATLERLGSVVVAGCRDATAARQLGLVPAHGIAAALDMARGRAGPHGRIGFVLAPPYFPIRVG